MSYDRIAGLGSRSTGILAVLLASISLTPASHAQCVAVLPPLTTQGDAPPFVSSPRSFVWDSLRQRGVVIANSGETWSWNGTRFERLAAAFSSFTNAAHINCAYDELRDRIVAFGGRKNSTDDASTYEFDGVTWSQVATTGPAPRGGHAMIYDPSRHSVLLMGGFPYAETCNNYFADTWAWDGSQWVQLADANNSPGARGDATIAFDWIRGVTVLFGGYRRCTGNLEDTWEFNGTTWTNRSPTPQPQTRPPASPLAAMYYNFARSRVEMVSRQFSTTQLWWWSGSGWNLVPFTGSQPQISSLGYAGIAFDPGRVQTNILLNGTDFHRFGDGRPVVTLNCPSDYVARVGGQLPQPWFRVTQTSVVSPVSYQWFHDGVPVTIRFGGATSPSMFPPSALLASDFGDYTCVATNSCGSTTSPTITLRVACPADFVDASTGSPFTVDDAVTIDDLLFYLDRFNAGNTVADLDDGSGDGVPDGAVTIDDLLYYLAHFSAGC
ncbi:MAG: immunoglobulin domain-containing protein [Phycisphaerales bacterium]|nr:MAG: immunoglobulin domain-containing protein [Phycisphaerales bacterium]